MKKIIYIFLLSVIFNYTYSQIAYMHYVTVKNSDVKEHIEAEKNVHSKIHKEEIDKGNKLAWDMWMISNSTYGEPSALGEGWLALATHICHRSPFFVLFMHGQYVVFKGVCVL